MSIKNSKAQQMYTLTHIKQQLMDTVEPYTLELNDHVTRHAIRCDVNHLLRQFQNTSAIADFAAICDDTNNTPAVRDDNKLVVDIAIKPARGAEFWYLNLVCARTSMEFTTADADYDYAMKILG